MKEILVEVVKWRHRAIGGHVVPWKGFFFANFEDIAGKLFRVFMDLSNNQSVDFDQKS